MKQSLLKSCVSLAVVSIAGLSVPAFAASQDTASAPAAQPAAAVQSATQAAAQPAASNDTLGEIVVTASVGNRTKLDSSVSISSVNASVIQDFHPMSEGDMLRLLPGIQPNVSGPGGNGNFAVRGLPVATGGATFVQLQEDGLPMVLYGDIQFGNNDYWTKSSPTDERVEDIRGGTASTLASQAPGAVINYISMTGRGDGGYVELEKGVNYDYTKLDFLDRGTINDSMYYNVGGFFDVGHGPWHASYNVSNSWLVKGNITKEFDGDKGWLRLFFKADDTQEPNDTGGLVCGSVSGNSAVWGGASASNLHVCPGFDIRRRSNYSLYNANVSYVDGNGNVVSHPLDGITTKEKALQAQLHYKFDNGITLDDNARYAAMSGGFASNFLSIAPISNTNPVPAGYTACTVPASLKWAPNGLIGSCVNGAVVASAVYAAGPMAGKNVIEPYYDNNVEVYTDIRNLDSFANDMKLNWRGNLGGDVKANLTAGWFFMSQKIAMDWHPNQYLAEVTGSNPAPIDLLDSAANLLTANGYEGYNNNWGSCCARSYDYTFSDNAPYADLILDYHRFEFDGSLRDDINHGSGSGADSTGYAYTVAQTTMNPVTGKTVQVSLPYYLADNTPEVIDYGKSLLSWSFGLSYKPQDNLNLFLRASKGTRFNADRLTFGGNFNANGTLDAAGQTAVADYVYQYEAGLKNRGTIGPVHYTAELTVYHSHFNITTYELNQNVCVPLGYSGGTCPISDRYRTTGVEFYGTARYHGLSVIANATFNKADKMANTADANTTYGQQANVWLRSSGIPDLSWSLAANYDITPKVSAGFDLAGVTSTLDSNGLEYPGSTVMSAHLDVTPVHNLMLGINVYNLFNSLALMGPGNANNIAATNGSFVGTASAAIGRTITADAKFSF